MHLLLATRNADKVREISSILGTASAIRLSGLDDLGVAYSPEEEAIESYDTFHECALAKARYFARLTGMPAIADDSGLAVDALDGAPGVRSKRFSGRTDLTGTRLDTANNELLLQRLRGVPDPNRTAYYVCAAAIATPNRDITTTIGTCAGIITHQPQGSGGFGYDPLFLLPDLGVTFGQAAPETKNRRSHRARAFRALAAHLSGALPRG